MPSVPPTKRRITLLLAVGVCSGLAACRDRSITSYRIPKEPDAEQAPAPEAASQSGAPAIHWTVPDGWQLQPAAAMRLRRAWLRQPDRVWFFKMIGSSDLVETQKDAFIAFLKSVSLGDGSAGRLPLAQGGPAPSNTNDLPRSGRETGVPLVQPAAGGAGMDSIPVKAERGASLLWQAPADWQNLPGNAMRKGSYSLGGGAEVAITAFPGGVGGVLANVNRWRGQAGLAPVDETGLGRATTPVESNGLHFLLVDSEGASSSVVAALLPWNGATWFFKLTGPADAVARAKPSFLSFLKTVRAP